MLEITFSNYFWPYLLKNSIYQLGGRGGRKKAFFIFPEIKIWKIRKLRNYQILFFRTGKSIILLPPLPPTKTYIPTNQYFTKWSSPIKGGEGGVKKSFFSFQKMNFINSANCGILIFLFLRTKKERFLSTLSTPVKNSTLIISIINNNSTFFNGLWKILAIGRNLINEYKRGN